MGVLQNERVDRREQRAENRSNCSLFSIHFSLIYHHFQPVCLAGYPVSVVAGLNLEGKAAGIVASPEGIR